MGTFDDPGPAGDLGFHGSPYADLRYPGTLGFFSDTGTKWVRLFAQWNYWEPGASSSTSTVDFRNQQFATDTNIILAKQSGLRVILCTRGFPTFANGSTDRFEFPSDRNLKALSPYSNWVFHLLDRYHPSNRFLAPIAGAPRGSDPHYRWIDYLEVVNEPNLECHPQSAAARKTALMFETAYGVARSLNAKKTVNGRRTGDRPVRLMGPATADASASSRATLCTTFTRQLLADLKALRFNLSSSIFSWSHHDYFDVRNEMPLQGTRAQQVRVALKGKWGGYPSPSVNSPRIFLTEGGHHRPNGAISSAEQDTIQNRRLAHALNRLEKDTGPGEPGAGIEMFTQFLFSTSRFYDSGLCRPPAAPGAVAAKRPAYVTWKNAF